MEGRPLGGGHSVGVGWERHLAPVVQWNVQRGRAEGAGSNYVGALQPGFAWPWLARGEMRLAAVGLETAKGVVRAFSREIVPQQDGLVRGEAFGVKVAAKHKTVSPPALFLQSDGVPPPRGALWTTARAFRAVDEEDALFNLSQSQISHFITSNLASNFQTACICTASSKLSCARCLLVTLVQAKDSFPKRLKSHNY